MYYTCSENKGADQLRGYREADLRLCFRICRLLVFSYLKRNKIINRRTIGPENAHLKPDLGAYSHHEMTLTWNPQIPLLVVCICQVSGLRLH